MAYTFAFYLGSNAGVVFFFFCEQHFASGYLCRHLKGALFFLGVLWGDGIME